MAGCQDWRDAKGQCPRKSMQVRLPLYRQQNKLEIETTSNHQLPWVCILSYLVRDFDIEEFFLITQESEWLSPDNNFFARNNPANLHENISYFAIKIDVLVEIIVHRN